jgi:alkylation response protein AidB-like acyl-CoA dehydrogenase
LSIALADDRGLRWNVANETRDSGAPLDHLTPGIAALPANSQDELGQLVELLSSHATQVDATSIIPAEHFERFATLGLYGIFAPSELGGLGFDLGAMCAVIEVLASACLATTFVWMQHSRLLLAALDPASPSSVRDLLPAIVRGECKGGVALGGLLPGPPRLLATPAKDGWLLRGDAPWLSGWGVVDVLAVTARGPDNTVVNVLLDATLQPNLHVEHHQLSAINATATVKVTFDDLFVANNHVVSRQPYEPERGANEGLRVNGSLALAIIRRCCVLIGPSPLDDELRRCREELDRADAATMPSARAKASALAVRASHLLAVHRGSSAARRGDVAERTQREAALLLVFGSRPSIKASLLKQWL